MQHGKNAEETCLRNSMWRECRAARATPELSCQNHNIARSGLQPTVDRRM